MRRMWGVHRARGRGRHDDIRRIIGSTIVPRVIKANTVIDATTDL
jgi:hypothetical protein